MHYYNHNKFKCDESWSNDIKREESPLKHNVNISFTCLVWFSKEDNNANLEQIKQLFQQQ